jgi:glutaredoxin 3
MVDLVLLCACVVICRFVMFSWGSPSDKKEIHSLETLIAGNRCVMFSMPSCPWCVKAEEFLSKKKLMCKTVNLQDSQFLAFEVIKATGQRTVPNIFIDGTHVGGHDSLIETFDKCQKGSDEVACDFFRNSKRRTTN